MQTKHQAQGKKHDLDLESGDTPEGTAELVPIEKARNELKRVEPELERELEIARDKLRKLEAQIREKAATADGVVHAHAWKFIGAAAGLGVGVGFIAGALTFRK